MATTLTRWRPFAELELLRSRMDRLFDDAMGAWTPAIDVQRDDDKLIVRADVPGIKPDEITVEVDEGLLTLSGEHEETEEEKGTDFVRRERRYGSFRRAIALPRNVDADAITAVTQDGVLEVTVPLPSEEQAAPKVITPTPA
jgi:HSP20 family protein